MDMTSVPGLVAFQYRVSNTEEHLHLSRGLFACFIFASFITNPTLRTCRDALIESIAEISPKNHPGVRILPGTVFLCKGVVLKNVVRQVNTRNAVCQGHQSRLPQVRAQRGPEALRLHLLSEVPVIVVLCIEVGDEETKVEITASWTIVSAELKFRAVDIL